MTQNRVAIEIKARMEHLGLTAAELGRRAGVGRTCIPDILTGNSINPRADTLKKIADALGCTPNDLVQSARVTLTIDNGPGEEPTVLTVIDPPHTAALQRKLDILLAHARQLEPGQLDTAITLLDALAKSQPGSDRKDGSSGD